MSQQGAGKRNELRHNEYFNVGQHVSLRARVSLQKPSPRGSGDTNFAIMQSHVKDFLGYHRGPLVIIRYMSSRRGVDDHLWFNLREDLRVSGKSNTYYDIGPRPDGVFTLEMEFQDKKVTVKVNNEVRFGPRDVSYFSDIQTNYIKTGLYMTSWDSTVRVQIDELTMGAVANDDKPTRVPRTASPTSSPTARPTRKDVPKEPFPEINDDVGVSHALVHTS